MAVVVRCTDEHPDSDGNRRPCRYRKDGLCTKKVLHVRLYWNDDAYQLNCLCADEKAPEGS